MSKNQLRLSQLVGSFGPGAMVDLPTRSVVIGGLEQWEMRGGAFTMLSEPRLQAKLEKLLKAQDRLDPTAHLSLRTPPITQDFQSVDVRGVAAPVFPTWFVCETSEDGDVQRPDAPRRRRLVPWKDLDAKTRRRFEFENKIKSDVTPIRFVCACQKGHLQDIDWRWAVHAQDKCGEPMWVEEKGTSADPADTSVVCGCGKRLSLRDTFQVGRLGRCVGKRPWLLDTDPDGCGEHLKLLTRTATNTYFPQVYTVISLPSEEDELTKLVDELAGELTEVASVADVAIAKRFNSKVKAALGDVDDADIFDALMRVRESATVDTRGSAKPAEFDLLASGRPEIGSDTSTSKLYAQTLARDVWAHDDAGVDLSAISALVAVHRLREVSSLYGFTRFEAAPTAADDEMEDVQLAVFGAPISKGADWLPAVEQFGEGLFIHFDPAAIGRWLKNDRVGERHDKLLAGFEHWKRRFQQQASNYPGTPYVLLHSLSHALMAEIALDCGYPSSSLKERVYAVPGQAGAPDRFGILIYDSGRAGHPRRPRGNRASLCRDPARRSRSVGGLFQRSDLRRPRTGRPHRRPRHPWRRLPQLPPHRRNKLRTAQPVPRPSPAGFDHGVGRGRVLLGGDGLTMHRSPPPHRPRLRRRTPRRQLRKGTNIPYLSHLLGVCALVLDYGGDEDQAIAGLLHDVIEGIALR